MQVFGVTGGLGMGKSTVASWLERNGDRVVDTDLIAREVAVKGAPALVEIAREFGPEVVAEDGTLRRDRLGQQVFGDAKKRTALEAILHPRIRARWRETVEKWRQEQAERCFVVIPLLYETGAERELDRVICVACSAKTQLERLRTRGMREEDARQRIAAQWSAVKKMELADFVVWNEGPAERAFEQMTRILA